jgi:hypothetical protein
MTNWYYGIEAAVEAFLLAVITARIPTKAAQIVDHTVSSTLGDVILGTTLSGAIRDGVKAIPQAPEMTGKLGGQALNGVLNLADTGATQAMRKWDGMRQEQLQPIPPPKTEDLRNGTNPLRGAAGTQGFNNDWPTTRGLKQPRYFTLRRPDPGDQPTERHRQDQQVLVRGLDHEICQPVQLRAAR